MSDMSTSQLIINQQLAQDEWTFVPLPQVTEAVRMQAGKPVLFKLTGEGNPLPEQVRDTVIPPQGKIILPLAVVRERQDELTARLAKHEIGVWLATHERFEDLSVLPDVHGLPLIAVLIEHFFDGRAYSLAHLIRTRLAYTGELRALGDVLPDQLFYLKRVGFNSYKLRADRDAREALPALHTFTQPYQAAVDESQPLWRRVKR